MTTVACKFKKKKNLSFPTLLLAFFAVLLTPLSLNASNKMPPQAQAIAAKSDSIQKILKRGVLRVVMHKKDHPPFFMTNDKGESVGLDVEIAQEIADLFGVKLEINREIDSFDGLVNSVATGESDIVISKLSMTLKRAKIVRYTNPYMDMGKALLINRVILTKHGGHLSINELLAKDGAKVGAIAKSSYAAFAQRIFSNSEIYTDPSWDKEIVPRLMKGEIWAAFRDELEVRRTLFLTKDAPLYMIGVALTDQKDPMMMVVHKDAQLFQQWINLYLQYAYKRKPLSEVIKKYEKYVYN